ncbi:MAG TPA: single-stranded-DNA-specific exonuclease RecJ [Solirubrobacteraceae bacterium]|jgi:single-stranded-DNA-specific exonuclease|nr:single-stranded-DNA-specific exonuclease RecJ [Solirubrobacteraceae bacterium]
MVRFDIADCDRDAVAQLCERVGVSDPIAQALVRRGYADPDRAAAFLAADERHGLEDFPGLLDAARLIVDRACSGMRITIHGDYDVDGVCSTAVLVRALRKLGAHCDWHLPDRAEGYGLSAETVRRLYERGTGLLITADCGITAVEEVALARSLGIEVIVSDHHRARPDGVLPDAPIVHPGISGYPCPELCATAVAHKLAQACFAVAGSSDHDPRQLEEDLDLVALATIADVVPLLGENRSLTRRGLRALAGTNKPGLRALMAVARIDPSKVTERAVGFGLAPRINAAGRLYRADAALELIMTEDRTRAAVLAEELDRANSERRQGEQMIRGQAEAQIAQLPDVGERWSYVLAAEGWHPGVIGIVASRLAEMHGRPVVLVAIEQDRARGSGRSVEGYDLLAGLTACSEHLGRYGGHSAAAGVELGRESLEDFAATFERHAAAALSGRDPARCERVDAVVTGPELGMELAEELATLAPFGRGNPTVSLLVRGALVSEVRSMGEGKHARFRLQAGGAHARAVAFGCDGRLPVSEGEPVDATFALEVNEWRGVSEPRIVLREAQPASREATLTTWQRHGQAQSTLFPLPQLLDASAAPI